MTSTTALLMAFFTGVPFADPVDPTDPQSVISLLVSAVISSAVVVALVTGLVNYLINRRNSRIQERKNSVDAESDLVGRYKEAASEERAQKESAVQTIKNLLAIAEEQVASLKSTITTLNATIDTMNKMANAQQEIIDQLTFDRDRTKIALEKAQDQITKQKEDLIRHQREILELTYPKSEIDKIRADVLDNEKAEAEDKA